MNEEPINSKAKPDIRFGWFGLYNVTFSTNRLYCAIGV